MVMDSHYNTFPDYSDHFEDFKFNDETTLPSLEQSRHDGYGLEVLDDSLYIDGMHNHDFLSSADIEVPPPSLSASTKVNCPDDPVLKFVNQIMLEESFEDEPSKLHDPLTLQAVEKSLYDAIGENYPPSPTLDYPTNDYVNAASPDSSFESTSGNSITSSNSGCNSVDHLLNVDPGDIKLPAEKSQPSTDTQPLVNPINSSHSSYNGQIDSSPNTNLVPSKFSDSEYILLFNKGMEEAMKFLPTNNQLNIDLYQYTLPPKSKQGPPNVMVEPVEDNSKSSNRRKKHLHQDSELEGHRSRKHAAVYEEEVELSELFDKVLLRDIGGFNSYKMSQSKKQGAKPDDVDMYTLIANCARSVASDNHKATNEQLEKIREHASSTGDACQRLANIISDGIEARLAGTGTQIYAALTSKKISAVERLKAYQTHLSAAPFLSIAMCFANDMILKTASNARTLHIVDFGIQYGFQWPMLIQLLSCRKGGPPKLRITGIELPQYGFRPTEKIDETGSRLAKYCKRFNVPFEFQAIATRSWEKINIDDLKLDLKINISFFLIIDYCDRERF